MKGEILNFGEVSPDRLQENNLIGLEHNGSFELHEILTKIVDDNKPSMVVCRSFTQPENIKTLSFWSDIDRPIFIPEKAFTISDFVLIRSADIAGKVAAPEPKQADLSALGLTFDASKVAFYGEKQLKSGKYKFSLILKKAKGSWMRYTAMSGKSTWGYAIHNEYSLNNSIRSLKRQGYVEKTL